MLQSLVVPLIVKEAIHKKRKNLKKEKKKNIGWNPFLWSNAPFSTPIPYFSQQPLQNPARSCLEISITTR